MLDVVEIIEHHRLTPRQLREILDIVDENRDFLLAKWKELQGDAE